MRNCTLAARAFTAAALASACVILGGHAPTARAETVPWGAGCSPAAAGARTSSSCGAELVNGRAIAPTYAPPAVKRVIAAANEIDHRPYVWGGGHASFFTKGYDCSGAVSYALHGAGLLGTTMVSGQLASWGSGGVGRWITVYANNGHVFMVVAGLRFDTRSDPPGESGPRWHRAWANPRKFVARHPAGL
jgi:cell wall-associated NlpC family hydrolase